MLLAQCFASRLHTRPPACFACLRPSLYRRSSGSTHPWRSASSWHGNKRPAERASAVKLVYGSRLHTHVPGSVRHELRRHLLGVHELNQRRRREPGGNLISEVLGEDDALLEAFVLQAGGSHGLRLSPGVAARGRRRSSSARSSLIETLAEDPRRPFAWRTLRPRRARRGCRASSPSAGCLADRPGRGGRPHV